MNKNQSTYPIQKVIRTLALLEIGFWLIFYLFIQSFGFLAPLTGDKYGFQFAKPDYFYLLLALVPFSYLFILSLKRKNKIDANLSQFSSKGLVQGSLFWAITRFFLLRTSFVFLILALAQPIYGRKKVKGTMKSMELVVCLDVSNSMNTCDIESTPRLEIAKRSLNALINTLAGEKIGLCLFAGSSYVQLPLTTDYNAAKLFVEDVSTYSISRQGTNIPDALSTAMTMFTKEKMTKAILIVTDGENHEQGNDEIYNEIIEKEIQVCALGIGTELGGPVPEDSNNPKNGYRKNAFGQNVVSKMNPDFVKQIANKTNGYAMTTSEAYPDLQTILTQINQMKRAKLRDLEFEIAESRYQVPLILSLSCWILWLLLPGIKLRMKK
jgi:Ca-activated chloride channel family protein